MTKFEEELNKYNIFERTVYLEGGPKEILIAHFKNWHSDEEFQEMKESYWNQAESILSMLDEIKSLKSQLQQQALPVVPELTQKQADILNDYKNGSGSLASYLSTEIKKGDYDYFARAWLDGYTVEKPQLFYLKNKIELEDVGSDLIGYLNLFLTNGGYLTNNINRAKKFTQQEIDSMQTGSYEQIEVAE